MVLNGRLRWPPQCCSADPCHKQSYNKGVLLRRKMVLRCPTQRVVRDHRVDNGHSLAVVKDDIQDLVTNRSEVIPWAAVGKSESCPLPLVFQQLQQFIVGKICLLVSDGDNLGSQGISCHFGLPSYA